MFFQIGVMTLGQGLLMLFSPSLFHFITQRWKNDSKTSPSNLFIFTTRFGGFMTCLAGISAIALQFIL